MALDMAIIWLWRAAGVTIAIPSSSAHLDIPILHPMECGRTIQTCFYRLLCDMRPGATAVVQYVLPYCTWYTSLPMKVEQYLPEVYIGMTYHLSSVQREG